MAVAQLVLDLATRQRAPHAGDKAAILGDMRKAPFAKSKPQPVELWIVDPADSAVLGQPHPSIQGQQIDRTTMLDTLEWHVAKHTALRHLKPATTPPAYVRDLELARLSNASRLRVFVGPDRISGACAGAYLALGSGGAPLNSVAVGPGWSMLLIYDPARGWIRTGFPVETAKVQAGYPWWHTSVEVTQ